MGLCLIMHQSLILIYIIVIWMLILTQAIVLNFIKKKSRNAFVPYLYIQFCKYSVFLNKLTWNDAESFDFAADKKYICDDDDNNEIVFISVPVELMIRRAWDPQIL